MGLPYLIAWTTRCITYLRGAAKWPAIAAIAACKLLHHSAFLFTKIVFNIFRRDTRVIDDAFTSYIFD